MSHSTTEKYIINRIHNSYYQKIITISGFFSKKVSEWDDLYIKGNRYCPSACLHSNHSEFINLLNKAYIYSDVTSLNQFRTSHKEFCNLIELLRLDKCISWSQGYDITFDRRSTGYIPFKGKLVDKVKILKKTHLSSHNSFYETYGYVISIYFRDGCIENEQISITESELFEDWLSMGFLAQLSFNPNCIFYYLYNEIDVIDWAYKNGWIKHKR